MQPKSVALMGLPNSGKTSLLNALTGARQKTANYAGVTVELKKGYCTTLAGQFLELLDLPGIYSLDAISPDEAVTHRICLNGYPNEVPIDLIVCVVDATNLKLHLRLALAIRALNRPMILVLNMIDAAEQQGIRINVAKLQQQFGAPVVAAHTRNQNGVAGLHACFDYVLSTDAPYKRDNHQGIGTLHCKRSKSVQALMDAAVYSPPVPNLKDEKIDRWVLHPVFGPIILIVLMFLMFQAVFSWADPIKTGIEIGIGTLGDWVAGMLPVGTALHSLIKNGIFAGLGTILAFCPQILCLYLFILILEASGYLPRAAFLMDYILFKVGLTGRAFIPLLSSFACAIPSIMATRSIRDPHDRLITILIAPLITCSARLPIYTLLIAAFIPQSRVGGLFNLQGIVLFALYCFGIASALLVAFVMKHFRRNASEQMLLMELPAWRLPQLRDIALGLWDRVTVFLRHVGGIILALNVLLWFLSSFPAPPQHTSHAAIYYSFAGQIGRGLSVLFAPIGFNWEICVALIPGLAAREVAVSALGTVYAMSHAEASLPQLTSLIAKQWSLATALSLLTWYVFAPQCLSTLAIIRRETNAWRNVALAAGYLFGLAYLASFLVYQVTAFLCCSTIP